VETASEIVGGFVGHRSFPSGFIVIRPWRGKKESAMHIDRRRAPRVEVLGRVQGQIVSMDAPLTVREVSLHGLSFASSFSFLAGSVHEFRLTLGDGSEVLLRGRITRSDEAAGDDGTSVFITGVHPSGHGSGGGLAETVTMQSSKVDLEYKPQKADGSLDAGLHFKYDIKGNKEG
jgi:hypothetical protein